MPPCARVCIEGGEETEFTDPVRTCPHLLLIKNAVDVICVNNVGIVRRSEFPFWRIKIEDKGEHEQWY